MTAPNEDAHTAPGGDGVEAMVEAAAKDAAESYYEDQGITWAQLGRAERDLYADEARAAISGPLS